MAYEALRGWSEPIGILNPGASVILQRGPCLVTGWSFYETTGSASVSIKLRDGQDATGVHFAIISLSGGESVRDNGVVPPILARSGLYFELTSGSVEGSVYFVPVGP